MVSSCLANRFRIWEGAKGGLEDRADGQGESAWGVGEKPLCRLTPGGRSQFGPRRKAAGQRSSSQAADFAASDMDYSCEMRRHPTPASPPQPSNDEHRYVGSIPAPELESRPRSPEQRTAP